MGDYLEPLTKLYARFDAITKELAQRNHLAARRGALVRLAANRELAAASRQDAPPSAHEPDAITLGDSQARYNALRADVMNSLQRVCPIMPAEQLDRLVTRATLTEMEYEERAMASSAVYMRGSSHLTR